MPGSTTPEIAEVPDAIWVPAHASRFHKRPADALVPYSLIVIHITSGRSDIMRTAERWKEPPEDGEIPTAAHFGVDTTKVVQAVKLRYAANHAHTANPYSIGIEHAAREPGELYPGDPGLPPTLPLYQRSARLVAYLLRAAGLEARKGLTVMGHAEADPVTTHTGCPDACGWDWELYMRLVRQSMTDLGAPPAVG